ncbi:zinc finger protein ubi-d4-like isoform X4 [Crassostrea virginica]
MDITIKVDVLKKCMGGDTLYKDAIEHTANLNLRMGIERKLRLPFLDSQTGVAQSHTSLWHPYRDRQPGLTYGQLYSYPANRWKKKKRLAFMNTESRVNKANDIETGESDVHQISTVENPAICKEEEGEKYSENSKDRWYDEIDDISEPPDAGEMVDDQSDISDYEETYIKKKKKKSTGRGRKKNTEKEAPQIIEEKDKPYSCEGRTKSWKACGARYKTRPGLQYHYNHFHNGMIEDETVPSPRPPVRASSRTAVLKSLVASSSGTVAEKSGRSGMDKRDISANNYCDFCLGDSEENKKSNQPEELVSCSDCGRSGECPSTCRVNPQISGECPSTCQVNPQITGKWPSTCQVNPQITGKWPSTCQVNPQITGKWPSTCQVNLDITGKWPTTSQLV